MSAITTTSEILGRLTSRGRWFAGLGVATLVVSGALGQRDVMRIGVLVLALPLLSLVMVSRTRYRLSCARGLHPGRITAGADATAVVRVENLSRWPSGLLLLQDHVPWPLGHSRQFVVERLPGGHRREVSYALTGTLRGRYDIGPLQVRVVDPFGLAVTTRTFTTTDTLMVLPQVVRLPHVPLRGDWSGVGDARARAVASTGEDDVVPRDYRTGDELRRVHWKSTARSGVLMVRREEQPWRVRATVLLDTRSSAHRGEGIASSLEWAVTMAASVATHLAERGYAIRLLDLDGVPLRTQGRLAIDGLDAAAAHVPVLDALAVLEPTRGAIPGIIDAAVRERARDGLIVAVLADLNPVHAAALARLRRGRSTAIALVADLASWPGPPATGDVRDRQNEVLALLAHAGWRAATCGASGDLATTWRAVSRTGAPQSTPSRGTGHAP